MSIARKILMGSSGGAKKVYSDDVFSTYIYKGTGSSQTITNNIDISGEGGMVWIKTRDAAYDNNLFDTARGAGYYLQSNADSQQAQDLQKISAFNTNGFSLGNEATVNQNNKDVVSWTFRKQKGFFDVITYTGNGVAGRQIPHGLGSMPGCIMIKNLDDAGEDWLVYHRSLGTSTAMDSRYKALFLNMTVQQDESEAYWQGTYPTSSNFTVGGSAKCNADTKNYVAYVFGGGRSPTDYSTYLDGNGDYLSMTSSSDLQLDGDFTIEFWFYPQDTGTDRQTIIGANTAWGAGFAELQINNTSAGTNTVSLWDYNSNPQCIAKSVGLPQNTGQVLRQSWHHIAVVRKSNNIRIYIDGALANYTNDNNSATIDLGLNGTNIGKNTSGHYVNGKISNLRVVKGQAIYESNFVVPQSSLTTTSQGATASNVKLLCCNTSTTTGSTVTPGTITANGDVAVNVHNPFIDSKCFKFGEEGDQNMIACGKYTGKSEGSDGPWVDLGWSPQWILIKRINGSAGWQLFDTMRGIATGGNDLYLNPNSNMAEVTSQNRLRIEPFGFRLDENDGDTSTDGGEYVYMAIRTNDGLVSTPVEDATKVFAMDTGNNSATIPTFDSGFVVDWAMHRDYATAQNWFSAGRITGQYSISPNGTWDQSGPYASNVFDSNVGWCALNSLGSARLSWMWKNHAGFQTVTYKGNGQAGRKVAHSLGRAPEMMWVKARTPSGAEYQDWVVYHKGLNGGSNPADWRIYLNSGNAQVNQGVSVWNSTEPDSRYFTLGTDADTNDDAGNYYEYIAMLFASVDGISKVGYYDGQNTDLTITTGFQPRFIIVKKINATSNWFVADTFRGWGTNPDQLMELNSDVGQYANNDFGTPTATGFTVDGAETGWNEINHKYIYYAHA